MVLVLPRILEVDEVRIETRHRNDRELDERRRGPALKRLIREGNLVLPRRCRLLGNRRRRHHEHAEQERDLAICHHHPFIWSLACDHCHLLYQKEAMNSTGPAHNERGTAYCSAERCRWSQWRGPRPGFSLARAWAPHSAVERFLRPS